MMGPVEAETFHAITPGQNGIPGIANPFQPILIKMDVRAGKYTIVKIPGIDLYDRGAPVSHSPKASFNADEIGNYLNNQGDHLEDQRALKFQLLEFLNSFKSSGGSRARVRSLGGGESYQKVLQINNIFNTGEAEIQLSEDQYRAILQATGTPNLEKGIEGFRRETAPLQQQQLDMAGTYSDPLDNLQEYFSRESSLSKRYRKK